MDQQAVTYYELRFRAQYLELNGAAFQDLFVAIMTKAHPADFFACRPWGRLGDRKNDGYLKSERTLFQVYAPNEMRLAEVTGKIETDFKEALPYWREHFDTWVFVHNSHIGLPPDVIAKLLRLECDHHPITVTQWGFDELLQRLRRLPPEALLSLYGSPPPAAEAKKPSEVRRKLDLVQELTREGKGAEAEKVMKEALAIARADGAEEEEVEVLIALALSVGRSGSRQGRTDRQYYFQKAEELNGKVTSNAVKVIYFRARAATLDEAGYPAEAEEAYRAALECCRTQQDDEKGNLATQGCVVRSSFVHFLCNQKRVEEAQPFLAESEEYARAHGEAEEGELLQAALEAGIHYALEIGNEDGAIERINELEHAANTSRLADRMGGALQNIANRASHRNAHRTALAAAETSVRLARLCAERSPSFLVGALYTEAMVILKAGNDNLALQKAEAILDLCNSAEDAIIKQATLHLIAEIKRCAGDSQAAVDLARSALGAAGSRLEDVAFTKLALARALNDNGETEDALKQANEAWVLLRPAGIPAIGVIDVLGQVSNYGSQLGAQQVVSDALTVLTAISEESEEIATEKARVLARADANGRLRERLLEFANESNSTREPSRKKLDSLAAANAEVVSPLISWWDDVLDTGAVYVAGAYEFWGRGNFARILRNARDYPNSFNVTLEVRSLEDVKRAIRLWVLYADFLILLWKGPTETAWERMLVPLDFEAPGGWGYMVFLGTVLRKEGSKRGWSMGLGYGSTLPSEVTTFLATDGRAFIQSGRLVVVPAVGAGCINPGHGPFEQLLAESANAVPSIRWKGIGTTPIGHIPYSPDAPFEVLADMADAESVRLRKLRLLFLRRSREMSPDGDLSIGAKALSLEIDDALRDLEGRTNSTVRKKGLAKAKEPVEGTTARFRSSGARLSEQRSFSPFAPLFVLQSLGYGWQVEGTDVPRFPPRFEPQGDDVIGAWLAPPKTGWTVPMLKAETEK